MSIQATINQGLAIGAALATQTPQAAARREAALKEAEYKKAEANFNERRQVFGNLTEGVDIGQPGDEITETQKNLFKGKEGAERSAALDMANEGYVAAAERMAELKPTAENFKRLAERQLHGEARHMRREELMASANNEALEKKRIKQKQSTEAAAKRKSYLDLETSLGGTVRDLNLSKEQRAALRAQLKENK